MPTEIEAWTLIDCSCMGAGFQSRAAGALPQRLPKKRVSSRQGEPSSRGSLAFPLGGMSRGANQSADSIL
jgi:hypothetical protein